MKKILAIGVLALLLIPLNALGANLTGVWGSDDNGTYYIRQIDNQIVWFAERSPANQYWANVAYGTISGDTITLTWADVPKGNSLNNGVLVLKYDDTPGRESLYAIDKNPVSYGGSTWYRLS
ncbi:MAG: hypothetical protein EHM14_11220 [Methanothrix sp.]|nr:MAG: hypothetical protein EHM14_11220 [Methanothrix sp.]